MPRPLRYTDTQVLDAATELLWRDGADVVSVRDLEAALDLKAPSLYRRFGSRHELIARSVDRYVERVVGGRVRRILEAADDPLAGLRAFFDTVLDPMPGDDAPRGCLLTVTAGQAVHEDPAVRAAVHRGFAAIGAAFRSQLDRAVAAGQLPAGRDLDGLAAALLIAYEGLLVLARAGHPDLPASIDATFALLPTT